MASTLQIVDPDDSSQVLFDLNDQSGSNSGLYGSVTTWLRSNVDLGVPALNSTGSTDIAKPLAFNRQATARMQFGIRFTGTSYDNINTAVGVLSRYLADGCVMKWIPNGSSTTRLIDVLPSPTPLLFAGRELNMQEATVLLQTPEGITLELERLAYTRADKLTSTVNLLANPTLLRDSNADGTPDLWTIKSTPTLTVVGSWLHVVAGASLRGVFQSTAAASASSGQVWTLSADVKVTSGTVAVSLDWRTAADALISTDNGTSTSATWTRLSLTATAPATTDRIRAIVQSSGAAATFDVRNVQLELAAAATPFRVGVQTLQVDPAATGFTNLLPVFNPSDAPAPCELLLAFPDATSKIVEADFGLISDKGYPGTRNLADMLNGPNYAQADASTNGWTRTLGTATASSVDADASGGNTALVTPTTDALAATPTKRVTLTRTTLLDSLRGRWKVYARVKGAGARELNFQLNWGAGTVAGESNEIVTHDLTNATSFHYVYIDVGDIELPREKNVTIGQLTLELYGWQTDGTKVNFSVDHLAFAPTDDSAIATIPGESYTSIRGYLLTTPDQLGAPTSDPAWSAGATKSGAMRLNSTNEAAGLGDNTVGYFTGSANTRHSIRFNTDSTVQKAAVTLTFNLGLANLTDNTVTQITQTHGAGHSLGIQNLVTEIVSDDTAAKAYQPRVTVTTLSGGGAVGHVDVNQVEVGSVPYIAQNSRLRSDPGSLPTRAAVEQVDSSGNLGLEVDATGVPFWLPPGLSLVWITVFDIANLGYDENASTLARTFTVTPTIYPRFWG